MSEKNDVSTLTTEPMGGLPMATPKKQTHSEGFDAVLQDQPRGVNDKVLRKRKILVTGDQGFIASRVVQKLLGMGHDVYGFDILTGQNLLNLQQVEEFVKRVDVVFHIAAEADFTRMSKSIESGFVGARINVEGTHNVAFACAKYNKWMVYASTVCVYGNQKEHPEREDVTLPNPGEIYACTKYAGEWVMRGYGQTFMMPWTSLRFATIYGEGMRPALGVSVFFRQAMSGVPITVHGDGNQDRTLTFVEDLVEGIVATLEHEDTAKGQVINLTAPKAVSANQMAEDIQKLVAEDTGVLVPIQHIEQRPNQTLQEDFDVSKAKNLLGWEAKTSWEDGLIETYKWMKKTAV